MADAMPPLALSAAIMLGVALMLVGVVAMLLLVMTWRRLARVESSLTQFETITAQLGATQATSSLIDQRLDRLHSQFAEDNAQLREQVGTRMEATKLGAVDHPRRRSRAGARTATRAA
ncbi:MAG: hypothetical protein IPG43_20230 [Proteobacteria bacterium]|nr:hypothetical protein [Pseudomonadota bacterium]